MDKDQRIIILPGYEDWYQEYVTRHGGATVEFKVKDGSAGLVQSKEGWKDETGDDIYVCRFDPPGLSVSIPTRFLNPI